MKKKKILTRLQINIIIKKYRIRIDHFIVRENGLIDVTGNVHISNTQLNRIPLLFGKVSGNFYCSSNKLKTLKGCPSYVGGVFNCYGNELKTLKGGPIEVGSDYFCHENRLESLIGAPKAISGNFNCFINKLTSLSNGPHKVGGSYYGNNNLLKNLKGSPNYIGGSFYVTANYIENLEYCPEKIENVIAIDNTVKLYFGSQRCVVKQVEIEIQSMCETCIPQQIIDFKKYFSKIFKYGKYLELYSLDGTFDIDFFMDLIFDFKTGLR